MNGGVRANPNLNPNLNLNLNPNLKHIPETHRSLVVLMVKLFIGFLMTEVLMITLTRVLICIKAKMVVKLGLK
jgi:hypothetical protein